MAQDPNFWVAEVGLTANETMAAASMLSTLVDQVNARTISRGAYLKALIAATVVVIQDGAAPIQITKQPTLHHFVEPVSASVIAPVAAKASTGSNSGTVASEPIKGNMMVVDAEDKTVTPALEVAEAAAAEAAAAEAAAKAALLKTKIESKDD